MPPKRLVTQIGGPYSPENLKLFPFKAALVAAGYDVRHPVGDTVSLHDGRWRAVQTGQSVDPFPAVERDYYDGIRSCDFHCVANFRVSAPGSLGNSAATEIGYAMLHGRPILLTDAIVFGEQVDDSLKEAIAANQSHFHQIDFQPGQALPELWREGFVGRVDYQLGFDRDLAIMRCVTALFETL